jgi:hypothetical protein
MNPLRTAVCSIAVTVLAGTSLVFAQESPAAPPAGAPQQTTQSPGGWRRVSTEPPAQSAQSNPRTTLDPAYAQTQSAYPNPQNPGPVPAKLTIKPGTMVTVRLNQALSSDQNQPGDGFAATLAQPVVVDGIVVAERGQTVGGRVVEAQKAGRMKGVSRLGIQLTELTVADGQPVPIQSELVARNGRTSEGRDVGAVAATTATGAAIGAMADWGTGAVVGAGVGAVGGLIGVLLTRGHPTVLYPESVLTFRIDAPVTVSTQAAPQAFRYVSPEDYQQSYELQARTGPPPAPAPAYYGPAYLYPYPYFWGLGWGWGWGGPGFWGGGFWGGYWGRGFYGRGFYGRGFYGRGFRGFRR